MVPGWNHEKGEFFLVFANSKPILSNCMKRFQLSTYCSKWFSNGRFVKDLYWCLWPDFIMYYVVKGVDDSLLMFPLHLLLVMSMYALLLYIYSCERSYMVAAVVAAVDVH